MIHFSGQMGGGGSGGMSPQEIKLCSNLCSDTASGAS